MVVAGDVFADAFDLISVNVGIIGDKGELARLGADALGNHMAEYGVLGDIKWKPEWSVGRAGSDE